MENYKKIFENSEISKDDKFLSNMKKRNWLNVTKVRKNSKKGSMDIKSVLYKDVYNPEHIKPIADFTEADHKMLSRYKATMDMESKIKTFLPTELLKIINECSKNVENAYDSLVIFRGMTYMSKKDFKSFLAAVKKEYTALHTQMKPYLDNWEHLVVEPFIETKVKVLFPDITEEDLEMLVNKIPSAQSFEDSYRNYYMYAVSPLQSNIKAYGITESDLDKKNAKELLKDDVEYIIASILGELVGVSSRAYQQFLQKGKLASRTNFYLKTAPKRMRDIISFMGNADIDDVISHADAVKMALEGKDMDEAMVKNDQLLIKVYGIVKKYGLDRVEPLPADVDVTRLEALLKTA